MKQPFFQKLRTIYIKYSEVSCPNFNDRLHLQKSAIPLILLYKFNSIKQKKDISQTIELLGIRKCNFNVYAGEHSFSS